MTRLSIEAQGLAQIRAAMRRAPGETTAIINDGLRSIGRAFVPAKGTGPLADATPKREGTLSKSTFFEIRGSGDFQQLLILQPARTPQKYGAHFYGGFVRGGTKAHEIRPKYASVLRWFDAQGDPVFAKRVKHPGTKPNPYHNRTLARLQPAINNVARRMGERLAEVISRGG